VAWHTWEVCLLANVACCPFDRPLFFVVWLDLNTRSSVRFTVTQLETILPNVSARINKG
jgi:hypothetical protein